MAKKSARSKGYRRQNVKKPYLSKRDIVTLCVIVALLAVGAFFLFRYDDGALKVQDGAVVADGDNWLIVDGSNVRGRSRYYRLGEIGEIEGYTREKGAIQTDPNIPQYVFTPAAEDGSVKLTVTCSHSAAKAMAEYTLSTLGALENNTMGELQSGEFAGRTAQYYLYTSERPEDAAQTEDTGESAEAAEPEGDAPDAAEAPASDDAAEDAPDAAEAPASEDAAEDAGETAGRFGRYIVGYIDATHDSCVVIHAESLGDTAEACLTDEALTSLLEQAAAAVTLDEAK